MLAAKRNDITDVILSVENKRDFSEIKEDYIKGLNFHFVSSMMEVLDLALEKEQDVNDLDYNQYLMNTHKRVVGFLGQQDNETTRQRVN
jgi:ATP-dependent Lon protease